MRSVGVCGPLDVGDLLRLIPTGSIPHAEMLLARQAALASPAFDGTAESQESDSTIIYGQRTVAKVQHRKHERHETVLWFEELRQRIGIPAPTLLDTGVVNSVSGALWWLVLERIRGTGDHNKPTSARLQALGVQLRTWHESAPPHGLRLDEPGGLGVLLGTPRSMLRDFAYVGFSQMLADACEGLPMTAIHGDVAVGHNTLFRDANLVAILDPGAVHIGPPMLDLAWCLAVDLPHGADSAFLLDGYGRDGVDADALEALLPYMLLRRMIDTLIAGNQKETRWLADMLRRQASHLLELTGPGARAP